MSAVAEIEAAVPAKVENAKPKWNMKIWGPLIALSMIGGIVGGVVGGLSGSAVKGTWKTNFGSYVTITDNAWYSASSWGKSVSDVKKISGGYVITQNSATDAYNPSKFVKNEYHSIEGGYAYCSTKYDAATQSEAESFDSSAVYIKTDEAKGCNGFPFTKLTKYENPLIGSWTDNYNQKIVISASEWKVGDSSPHKIEAYGDSWILMQNPADAAYNPSKWSLVQWHKKGNDWAWCTSVYDGASAKATLTKNTATIYDSSNAATGCNGFPHSISTKA